MDTANSYTDGDVQELADFIVDAIIQGARTYRSSLAEAILGAGWRKVPGDEVEPRGDPDVIVRAWCPGGEVRETAVEYAPWLADRQVIADHSFIERVTEALDDLVADADTDDGSLEDAAAAEEMEGCEPAPWEPYGDGETPGGDDRG